MRQGPCARPHTRDGNCVCVCGSRGGHPEPPSHPKEQPKAATTAGGPPCIPSSATPARPAPPCAPQAPRGALGHPHNPSLPHSTPQAPLTTTPNLPNPPAQPHIPTPSFSQHRDHPRCNPAPGVVGKRLRASPPNARVPPQPPPSPGRQRERGGCRGRPGLAVSGGEVALAARLSPLATPGALGCSAQPAERCSPLSPHRG